MVIRITSRRVLLVAMFLLAISAEGRDPVLHRVGGGRYSWVPGINFSNWASQEQFYVGDWLYFGFNKTMHNVLEVNKTSYDECRGDSFITNITRGGRDVFNLTESKPYYFLCSRSNHCSVMGMKVEVLVTDPNEPLQVIRSSSSRCSTTATTSMAFLLFSCLFRALYSISYKI
ncbi:Lamin-like protein [Linum perenne]